MGVKYIIQFKSPDDVAWQCDIETTGYTGPAIAVRGVSEQAVQLDYDGDTADEAFNTFIKSTMTLNIYNQGQVDINELMGAADKDFLLKLFRNGHLYWTGFLQPENIQHNMISPPYNVALSFACGLSMLDTIPYVHQDLLGVTGIKYRCPMNYIRQILFTCLGIKLPIRWTNSVTCTAFIDDYFAGSVEWSPFNEGFYTFQQGVTGNGQGPVQTCGYILQGLLKAVQCRIYQANGRWVIRRVNDVIAGTINYKETGANLDVLKVIHGTETIFRRIGRTGYPFISENAILTNVRGIKSFKATYNANIRSNIIPNGNFDVVNTDLTIVTFESGVFLYWGSYDTNLLVNSRPSLDGQSGYSAELVNVTADGFFTMITLGGSLGLGGLPIDTFTLIKVINFGFMFSAGTGFPVDGLGLIDWTTQPLQFKMILRQNGVTYYLNEFGTWSTVDAFIPIVITGLKPGDIAQVNFDKFQGVKMPKPPTQPTAGDDCHLQLIFRVKTGLTYTLDNVSVSVDTANDVYEVFDDSNKNTSADNTELTISSSFGGYMLSNLMTSPFNSGAECTYDDNGLYVGTLTGLYAHAVMRFRYKPSQVVNTDMNVQFGNWSFDEIYSVDTLLGKKFLPLNAKYYVEKGIVNVVAMEARNDNITLRQSFYSSNDTQNSN